MYLQWKTRYRLDRATQRDRVIWTISCFLPLLLFGYWGSDTAFNQLNTPQPSRMRASFVCCEVVNTCLGFSTANTPGSGREQM